MSIYGLQTDNTDDEFFGTLQSQSNLASLFGVNQQKEDVNQSLKYKAPKQAPVSEDVGENEATVVAWNVQVAKVVTAFKLISQENISQGRVGLALLKNPQNAYKIIIYRTKSNILASKTLQTTSKLMQKSSYLQFHDDSQEFWSIFLETNDEKSFIDHLPAEFLSTIEVPEEKSTTIEERPESSTDNSVSYKEKLLSRMAKMGQPLPKLTAAPIPADMSDSSDTDVVRISAKPGIAPRKVSKQLVPVANASMVTYSPPQAMENQYLNMMLTENRTQNTELRMNISKLETKIERVLDRIDIIGSRDGARPNEKDKDDEIVSLEEKILDLRKENRTLRQTIREIEAKNTAVGRRGSKVREEMLSEFNDVIAELGVDIEDCNELELTKEILQKSKTKLHTLQEMGKAKDQKIVAQKEENERLKAEISKLTKTINDSVDLQTKVDVLLKENQDLKHNQDAIQSNSTDKLQTVVKEIMNNLYAEIISTLDNTADPVSKEAFLRICASAIRKESISVIQRNTN